MCVDLALQLEGAFIIMTRTVVCSGTGLTGGILWSFSRDPPRQSYNIWQRISSNFPMYFFTYQSLLLLFAILENNRKIGEKLDEKDKKKTRCQIQRNGAAGLMKNSTACRQLTPFLNIDTVR